LLEGGGHIEEVYFPNSGLLSLQMVMKNGRVIEVGSVGRRGIVGAMVACGLFISQVRVVAAVDTEAATIDARKFHRIASADHVIMQACVTRNEALLSQAQTLSACHALHPLEARYARYLLQIADAVANESFYSTHKSAATTMAVRRTSVTKAAGNLFNSGLINYSLGVVEIIDRPALTKRACECYHKVEPV
jgi:CRP-like cAMP-binding protein